MISKSVRTFKAIVLTCDRYRPFTDHMIYKYGELWPDHPFYFRIPYQELAPTLDTSRAEYKKTPANIKSTVLTLLDDLDDDELIYWCIDDKYPIKLDVLYLEKLLRWIIVENPPEIGGLLFCRCRQMLEDDYLTGRTILDDGNNVYLERRTYEQIWIHQFLRVGVLRHLFKLFPDVIPHARCMDEYKDQLQKPPEHQLYVSSQNRAVFGESTSEGIMIQHCYESIVANDLTLPEWCSERKNVDVTMGVLDHVS